MLLVYEDNNSYFGDLSAIIIENMPFWADFSSAPSQEVALMSEWETKMEAIISETINEDITSLVGVPSWMLVLLNQSVRKNRERSYFRGVAKFRGVFSWRGKF